MNILKVSALIVVLMAMIIPASAQPSRPVTTRGTYDFEIYITPARYPCLTETVRLFGPTEWTFTAIELPQTPGYQYMYSYTEIPKWTGVGMTTGHQYVYSGPYHGTQSGVGYAPYPLEFTEHNVSHFVDPTSHLNLFVGTLTHFTQDPYTGEYKVYIEATNVGLQIKRKQTKQ